MPPREVLLALLLASVPLAGCTASQAPPCTPRSAAGNASAVCVVAADGWILKGSAWNANATDQPAVLLVHGFREQHGQYLPLAERLAGEGWRVLAFDLRGHGQSTGRLNAPNETFETFESRDVLAMQRDLNASQRYLGETPDAIVGASIGANLALSHTATHDGVTAIALLSPIPGRGPLDPTPANRAFTGETLYVASQEDTRAAQTARSLADQHAGPDRLEVWPGRAHGTQHLDNATRLAAITGWLEAALSR